MDQFEQRYLGIVERYRELGFVVERAFMGCTDAQLEEISRDQGVQLPASYIALMKVMGRESGYLFDGSVMTYPEVLGLREGALEVCRDYGLPEHILDRVLVFMHHGGFQYWYINCGFEDDPVVWFIQEGCAGPITNSHPLSHLVELYFQFRLKSFQRYPYVMKFIQKEYSDSSGEDG